MEGLEVAFPAVKLNFAGPVRKQISARSLVPRFARVRPDLGMGHSSRPVIVRLGLARVASKYSGGQKKLDASSLLL